MQRSIPPLPQGWEARWDPGQGRYFFINHQTKKTQWDDPRYQPHQPQPQPQPQVNPYAAASSLSPSRGQTRAASRSPSPAQAYQMQEMSAHARTGQGHVQHGQQQTSNQQQESSMSEEVDQALVDKLHRDFPNTTKALISDILVGCYNNEREAREQLEDLGFSLKSDNQGPTSPTRTSARNSSGGNNQQLQQQAAAASSEMSQLDKNRIHQQMSVAFPSASMEVIEMTMKVVKYDVSKGKVLLQRFLENQDQKTGSSKQNSTTTSGNATSRGGNVSSSTARAASPARMEPAGLSVSSDNQPQGMSSGSGQIPTGFVSRMLVGSGGQNQSGESSAASTSSGRHTPTQYSNAKQVTNKKRKNVPPKKTVVTSQPRQSPRPQAATISAVPTSLGSKAMGPDPSLRRGPDSSLLSSDPSNACGPDFTLRNGPDRSLCAGPDRGRVCGSMGASGPDNSLRCGPQASLLGSYTNQAHMLVSDI